MESRKTIAVYERQLIERRQKGFFQEVTQSEVKQGLTKAAAEKELDRMNTGLRKPFSLAFYDLGTNKGKAAFLAALAENTRRTPTHQVRDLANIQSDMFAAIQK